MIGLALDLSLVCEVCKRAVDADQAQADALDAALFGAVRYAVCIGCGQRAGRQSKAYRRRWDARATAGGGEGSPATSGAKRVRYAFTVGDQTRDLTLPEFLATLEGSDASPATVDAVRLLAPGETFHAPTWAITRA